MSAPFTRCGLMLESGPCPRPKGHDFADNTQGDRALIEAELAGGAS